MALDRAKLGTLASEQMEALEDAYGEDERAEVGDVMTIVEVLTTEGDEVRSTVRTRFNAHDPYRIIGILRAAEQNILMTLGGGE
ncbi:MAG TPA: hypothetical protein VHT27_00835 [Solirubrobacteraceae bacterium]|jgi:hypothetical protein|nr:hypothetical protein [Solirubrobacteraceae bacterium]